MNQNDIGSSSPPAALDRDDKIGLLDLLYVLVDNWKLLTGGPLLVGLLAFAITFAIPPLFTATTKFLPPQQQQSSAAAMLQNLGALGGLAGAAVGIKNPVDQYVALLRTRSVEEPLISRFKLQARYDVTLKEEAVAELEAHVGIVAGKDGIIVLDVTDPDPVFAAQLANAYVDEFKKLLDKLALTEAQQQRVFFERQMAQVKQQLVQAEQRLKSEGVDFSALKASSGATIAAAAQLQAEITAQEVRIKGMRGYLTDMSPEYKRAQAELYALKSAQEKMAKSDSESGQGGDYIAKYRDVKYYETLFGMYAKQFEMARLDESREGAVIQVIDEARVPEKRSKPKKSMIVGLSVIASEFLLLIGVFASQAIRQQSDDPVFAWKLARLRLALFNRAK